MRSGIGVGLYIFTILTRRNDAGLFNMQTATDEFVASDDETDYSRPESEDSVSSHGWARSLMLNRLIDLLDLEGYGCWCYFDDGHGRGRGNPVDDFDKYCQDLHHGYACSILDSSDESDRPCTPWSVNYKFATYRTNLLEECTMRNSDNMCAVRACTVELQFVTNIMKKYADKSFPSPEFRHDNGFIARDFCGIKSKNLPFGFETRGAMLDDEGTGAHEYDGSGLDHYPDAIDSSGNAFKSVAHPKQDRNIVLNHYETNRACCGSYPYRFPYKPENGNHKCCGEKTYRPKYIQCCDPDESALRSQCN